MIHIQSLPETADPALLETARTLFLAYGDFLREIQACHAFNFERFAVEIRDLPRPYTQSNGDLLLALAAPITPVGCVALRTAPEPAGAHTCEIKRLFVLPAHRGQRIAEALVETALDRARALGYREAVLDTEPSTMQAAQHLYRKLGFTEYTPAHPINPVDVLYLRKELA